MKLAFIATKDNSIHFFKELADSLSKNVSGLELVERFVPSIDDVPVVALEESEEAEFIFVFALTENKEMVAIVKDKLIDVELTSGTRILKIVEEDSYSGTPEEEYYGVKEELVKKYSELIISILFNEVDFEPKQRDFSLWLLKRVLWKNKIEYTYIYLSL